MDRSFLRSRTGNTKGTLVYIQYFRGIAAMMVVWHHIFSAKSSIATPFAGTDFGRPGVLIFFAISGFVLMHACRDEPVGTFLTRRVLRIVPLYWVLTFAYFAIQVASDLRKGASIERFDELLLSLFFIPHYHSAVPDKIWPVLVPGWTLNYEVFFFLVFGIGLALGRVVPVVAFLLVTAVFLGAFSDSTHAVFVTWTDPVLLVFLGGMGLALLWQRVDLQHLWPLACVGAAMVLAFATNQFPPAIAEPALCLAALFCLVGVLAAQDRFPDWKSPLLARIGDASYSLYLLHTILLIFIFRAFSLLPLEGMAQFVVLAPVAFVLCVIGGLLCYRWVERPMLLTMRRWANV